ncbi:hypothetical protein [Acinetobacter sp. YZS-X1-1]|uniref:hypothetical protein n=1 Tax=Acinetobacter sp. YZS-X1-1 TaxID=1501691 RepID=UPI00054CC73F|nr:hypothetical protein [Acinetobacter sp. YZS-X1-1]
MVASTDIKFYVHTNNNAPQLQNAYGSMINVLDACLVNGINIGTISSLTASGSTVTALFSSAHNLMQYQVIKIAGAAQAEFNGEHRILTIPNSSSLTFELATAPSVTTATGAISASLPPLGWEKPFSSSNPNGGGKAAYRSTNLLLPSRPFLRVVDELDPVWNSNYAKYAKVGIVEDMSDIDTLIGAQVPYDTANPNKNWQGTGSGSSAYNGWAKWYYSRYQLEGGTADQTTPPNGNKTWIIVGDGDYFYISNITSSNDNAAHLHGFGCFDTYAETVDFGNWILSASYAYKRADEYIYTTDYGGLGSNQQTNYAMYDLNYSLSNKAISLSSTGLNESAVRSGNSNDIGYNINTPIMFFPVYLLEGTVIRGSLKNLFWLRRAFPFSNRQLIQRKGSVFIAVSATVYNSFQGQVMMKLGEI